MANRAIVQRKQTALTRFPCFANISAAGYCNCVHLRPSGRAGAMQIMAVRRRGIARRAASSWRGAWGEPLSVLTRLF